MLAGDYTAWRAGASLRSWSLDPHDGGYDPGDGWTVVGCRQATHLTGVSIFGGVILTGFFVALSAVRGVAAVDRGTPEPTASSTVSPHQY